MNLLRLQKKNVTFIASTLLIIIGMSTLIPSISEANDGPYYPERIDTLKASGYEPAKENSVATLEKTVTKGVTADYKQIVSFGPFNSGNMKPFVASGVLGDGSNANTGSFAINVFSEYKAGKYESYNDGGYLWNSKTSGFSLYKKGNTSTSDELYLRPEKTTFFTKKNETTTELKLLSVTTSNAKNQTEMYVIESTIISQNDSPELEVLNEVTNVSGAPQDMMIMYTTQLNFGDVINPANTGAGQVDSLIQSVGDNKGLSYKNGDRSLTKDIRTTFNFPETDGPESWTITNNKNVNSYTGFDRTNANRFNGSGLEKGYTKAEIASQPPLTSNVEGSPYVPGHILGDKSKNVVKFKSKLNNAVPMNGKINFNWKMVVGEQEIVDDDYLPERYEKINEQSKISLDDYEKINKMAPVEIKTNRINDYTDVRNFFVVGGHDTTKDTLNKIIDNTYTGGQYTSINADYKFKKVSFANPRVITYDKEKPTGALTSYSHSYDTVESDGDSQAFGGSGFGFVTVDDANKIINPSPLNEWNMYDKEKLSSRPLSKIEEVYLSNDKNTMIIYGDYTVREGRSGLGIKVPVAITLKSTDGIGSGTMSYKILNSFPEQKTFRSYYASHIDINGLHKDSKMRTLGNSEGIYFFEKNLKILNKDYYLAFYRAENETGTGPNAMYVKEFKNVDNIAPDWDVPGNSANAPIFDPSQPKGEEIYLRDSNGKVIPNRTNKHPGWGFLFPGGKVGPGEVVTSELEVKATDFILPDYSSVEIKPEANQKISKKEDLVYKPKFVQELDANMPSEAHRVKTLDVVFDYKPLLENVSSDDFKVLQDDVVLDNTGNKIYDVLINEANKTITVRFKDPFLFNNKYNPAGNKAKSHITLVQNSKIRTDSEEIVQYYNKTAGQFEFKIEAFNKFKLDILDSDIVQKNKSKETQIIKYIPRITAVPKTDITVNAGDPAGDPARYLDITYDKDFDFDDYEVTYKDDVVPVFKGNGTQDIFITVKSKKFGEQDKLTNIKVTVKVTEDVEMSFIHYVTSPTGKNEKIRNLKDPSYPEYKKDPVKINVSANFKTELKKYQDEKHLGYDYIKTIVKVDGAEITPTDKVPTKNFIVELYYKGQVILEQPDSFDFGSQKLSAVEQKEVSPKIKKDDSEADDREKMKIINTQGAESGWKLFAKQSIEMTNAGNPLKGRLYYISEDGQSQVTIDKNEKPIKMITSNNKAPFISNVPLLPGSKEQKMGIYLDIYPGNTRGEYSNGEITWELRNAL